MTGPELREILKSENVTLAAVADFTRITRQALNERLKAKEVGSEFLKKVAEFLKTTDLELLQRPAKPKKKAKTDITDMVVMEDTVEYGSPDYKQKYYNCLEESAKVKNRLIEVLEENRSLRMK